MVLPAGYPRSVGVKARICWKKKYPLFPVAGGRGYKWLMHMSSSNDCNISITVTAYVFALNVKTRPILALRETPSFVTVQRGLCRP